MDADCQERRRDFDISQREKRWSMNSQRLEEIVAELMKPISDVRRSFDTDLSALLEEYLTEAGLHALEDSPSEPSQPPVNFAELALVLQHSASVYGRKVDLLYQRVLDVSDDLLNTTQEIANTTNSEEPATPSGKRRRRASHALPGFEPVTLTSSNTARRDPAPPRPPPTLPRVYIELEPRSMTDCDVPLTDYEGEPIGLLSDFHVAWRLQDGVLVDELEGSGSSTAGSLRPIPLAELSAAIAAAAPPDPPRCSTPLVPRDTPPSSPSPSQGKPTPAPSQDTPAPPPVVKSERKRRCETKVELEDVGRIKILISKALRRELSTVREFSVPRDWRREVVRSRATRLNIARRHLVQTDEEFRGFDCSTACDAGGFPGWSDVEVVHATTLAKQSLLPCNDSDDDGFFERSSLGDSDVSRGDDTPHHHQCEEPPSWSEWQRGVLSRATAGESRGLDVTRVARRVLDVTRDTDTGFCDVLRDARADHHDVSHLFLATLFLANSGNVEIIQGPPLTLNSFSVRLLTRDQSRFSAATAAALADGVAGNS